MPEVFYSYRGLDIFYVYYQDGSKQSLYYWYCIYPTNDPKKKSEVYSFDVRDFEVETEGNKMLLETHKEILRKVIDEKILPPKDWLEETGWKLRLGRSRRT